MKYLKMLLRKLLSSFQIKFSRKTKKTDILISSVKVLAKNGRPLKKARTLEEIKVENDARLLQKKFETLEASSETIKLFAKDPDIRESELFVDHLSRYPANHGFCPYCFIDVWEKDGGILLTKEHVEILQNINTYGGVIHDKKHKKYRPVQVIDVEESSQLQTA